MSLNTLPQQKSKVIILTALLISILLVVLGRRLVRTS